MKNATILHVPHASITIPPQYLSSFDKSKLSREIAVMTDWFCDELLRRSKLYTDYNVYNY